MTDTPEAVRLAESSGWINAQSRVPDVLPSAGISSPVLVIAETDDACFQQTMAIYYSKGRSGMKFPHWRAQRFDDDRDGPVIKVRCWMHRPAFPKCIPGNWNDQPARSAIQAEFEKLEAERDQLRAELEKVRWQPIETAPSQGDFLVYTPNERSKVQAARKMGSVFVIGNAFAFDISCPTYWMPEPAAPTPPHADQKGAA